MIKNVKLAELKKKYCDCFLECTYFKDNLIECKCLCFVVTKYQQNFDERLKEQFFNTYKFSKHDNNKFILLLQKGIYPYEYMDDWGKMMQITRMQKEFVIEIILEDYHDLRVQSNTLLLADVLENF